MCKIDDKIVSIGAIKQKTDFDFNSDKADLDYFRNDFNFELGYCFTLPDYTGKGHSSEIVKHLIDKLSSENLMASTELREGNSMKTILERNGFEQRGKKWKSSIHDGELGLFLKFVKK